MRTKKGLITSAKMDKTVTVTVRRDLFHSLYQKRYMRTKKFLADTGEFADLKVGDMVEITECRPLSKNKCFRVSQVLQRAAAVSDIAEEKGLEEVMHRTKKDDAGTSASAS